MLNATTFIGLDVHARSIKAFGFNVITGEEFSSSFGYDHVAVSDWISSLPQPAKCVYESGVTGFDLQKKLTQDGIDCVIGAVSKMIKPAADKKKKNDRNDAKFLARMLSVGNITEVWIPDDECEAARDLVRALEDATEEVKRSKQLLSKFLLRHGLIFNEYSPTGQRKKNWTLAYWRWIKEIHFKEKTDQKTLEYYIDRVKASLEEKKRLEDLVKELACLPRWKKRVDSIRCIKGIDIISAANLVFEADEFSRFKNARAFASWLGLTPSEYSSGESVIRGGITKAGNKHLRRILVESSWHYLYASPSAKDLAKGQSPDPLARKHANKGTRRLTERRRYLLERGVQKNKANIATARELAGWVWAVGKIVEDN